MKRALFLDRDGVVNVDAGYTHRPDQVSFVEGIFDLCRRARACGYLLVVVTNQAGVARGLYTEEDVIALHRWMMQEFLERGIEIGHFYYCPFHPDALSEDYRAISGDRKPEPGMLLRAAAELNIDLAASIMVGDKLSDMEAARRAGIKTRILLGDSPADVDADITVCARVREVTDLLVPARNATQRD